MKWKLSLLNPDFFSLNTFCLRFVKANAYMARSVRISVIAALVVHSLSETACRLFAALTPEFIRNCTPYSVFVVRCRQTRKNRNIRRKTSKSIYQRYAFHKRLRQKTRRLCGLLLQRGMLHQPIYARDRIFVSSAILGSRTKRYALRALDIKQNHP